MFKFQLTLVLWILGFSRVTTPVIPGHFRKYDGNTQNLSENANLVKSKYIGHTHRPIFHITDHHK